jgi:hypothetical protein
MGIMEVHFSSAMATYLRITRISFPVSYIELCIMPHQWSQEI